MKPSTPTTALILALAAPSLAAQGDNRWLPIEALNAATGASLGYLWSEPTANQYPNPVYGDESFTLTFAKMHQNLKRVQIYDDPEGSTAIMSCARTGPSPCWGYGYFDVGGGEWGEAASFRVRAGFRYADTVGYKPDDGFGVRGPYDFYGGFFWGESLGGFWC
jgi:hypothetical protein